MNAYLATLGRMMAEMEQGLRPVAALDAIASPLAARRIRKLVHIARKERARTPGRRRRVTPPRVLATSSFNPSAGVTEGVVLLALEDRTRPYSIRLENSGEAWRLVEIAPPDTELRPVVTEASRTGIAPSEKRVREDDVPTDGTGPGTQAE